MYKIHTKYFNQAEIINSVHEYTGFPKEDIKQILDSLNIVVRDKISDGKRTKLKLFAGLTISSEFIPREEFNINLRENINSDTILSLSADFTKRFKQDVKNRYQKK